MQKKKLISKAKAWIRKNDVFDIILFGSLARGRHKPNDADICIIIYDKDEKRSLDILSSLEKYMGFLVEISILTLSVFINGRDTLVKTLFSEGISIKRNIPIAEIYGFRNMVLFLYSLKNFTSTNRVRFHYALRGRRGSIGLIEKYKAELVGDGTLLVPLGFEDEFSEVFNSWNVRYKTKRLWAG